MLELGVLQVDDVGLVVVEGDRRGGVCRLQDPIDGVGYVLVARQVLAESLAP